MKGTLFLPYIDYYNSNFDVDDNYYSNGTYEETLTNEYTKNKDIVFNTINDYFDGNTSVLRANNNQGNTISFFNAKVPKNEEKTRYSSCDCYVLNEYLKDITINDINALKNINDVCVLYVKLDFDTIEEEFEEDFKLWVKSHNNINNTNRSDEWKFENEPKRTFKLTINNISYELCNCRILEMSSNGFFILIEKIKESI